MSPLPILNSLPLAIPEASDFEYTNFSSSNSSSVNLYLKKC